MHMPHGVVMGVELCRLTHRTVRERRGLEGTTIVIWLAIERMSGLRAGSQVSGGLVASGVRGDKRSRYKTLTAFHPTHNVHIARSHASTIRVTCLGTADWCMRSVIPPRLTSWCTSCASLYGHVSMPVRVCAGRIRSPCYPKVTNSCHVCHVYRSHPRRLPQDYWYVQKGNISTR